MDCGETLLQIRHELDGRSRRSVAAVEEPVDADAGDTLASGELGNGDELTVLGVNAAGTDQADQMEGVVGFLRPRTELE